MHARSLPTPDPVPGSHCALVVAASAPFWPSTLRSCLHTSMRAKCEEVAERAASCSEHVERWTVCTPPDLGGRTSSRYSCCRIYEDDSQFGLHRCRFWRRRCGRARARDMRVGRRTGLSHRWSVHATRCCARPAGSYGLRGGGALSRDLRCQIRCAPWLCALLFRRRRCTRARYARERRVDHRAG